jgi:SulP family sulfate permease
MSETYHRHSFISDFKGGLSAAIVSLPISMSLGVASGLGAEAGIISSIILGFLASVFGGTKGLISSPTGPMTIAFAGVITTLNGNFSLAFLVVILGGIIQIGIAKLKLGRYISYISYSVISGFMSGVGLTLIIMQLPKFFTNKFSAADPYTILLNLYNYISNIHIDTVLVSLISFLLIIFWPKVLSKFIPRYIGTIAITGIIAKFASLNVNTLNTINLDLSLREFSFSMSSVNISLIMHLSLTIALIGIIDTLLTSLIADSITRKQHDPNKELKAQGIGNIFSALFGGLPGAGATANTLVNIKAGAKTYLSGAICAISILILTVFLKDIFAFIPISSLAVVLAASAWTIIDFQFLKKFKKAPKDEMTIMISVMLLTVFVDTMSAVGLGIIMTSLISSSKSSEYQLAKLNIMTEDTDVSDLSPKEREIMRELNGYILYVHMKGAYNFCSAIDISRQISDYGLNYKVLIIDIDKLEGADTSILMTLKSIIEEARESKRIVLISGVNNQAYKEMEKLDVLRKVKRFNLFSSKLKAFKKAKNYVKKLT